MGRIGISDLQVFKVADQLALEGIRPTVDTVRAELGDTGSRTTINRYLKEWRERQEQRTSLDTSLGEHLSQFLKEQASRLLNTLEDTANRKFEAKKAHYEELITNYKNQLTESQGSRNNLQQQLDDALNENSRHQTKAQQLQAQLINAQDDLQIVRDQLAKETGRREALETALGDQQQQVMSLQKQIASIRDRNEILAESLASKTSELHANQHTERDLRGLLKQKNEEIKKVNQSLRAAQKQHQDFGKLTKSMTKLVSTFKESSKGSSKAQ